MILNARSGIRGTVWDLDTGKLIRKVLALNTDTGYVKALQCDAEGNVLHDAAGNELFYEAAGRFKFVPREQPQSNGKRVPEGAKKCCKCGNWLTLPGSELCVHCHATDKGIQALQRVERLASPLLEHPCGYPGCGRLATHSVGDEVEAAPERAYDPIAGRWRWWARGATVARRFYCAWHFQAPRILDARGEVVEEVADIVRP